LYHVLLESIALINEAMIRMKKAPPFQDYTNNSQFFVKVTVLNSQEV